MADKNYSDAGFWQKLNTFARKAGREVVDKSLQLYYAAESPDTPRWAKGVIYCALAYFVAPIDAIPDITPAVGFTDDLAAILGALGVVAAHITPEVKRRAADKLTEWFD